MEMIKRGRCQSYKDNTFEAFIDMTQEESIDERATMHAADAIISGRSFEEPSGYSKILIDAIKAAVDRGTIQASSIAHFILRGKSYSVAVGDIRMPRPASFARPAGQPKRVLEFNCTLAEYKKRNNIK